MEKRKGWEELIVDKNYVGSSRMQYEHFIGSTLAISGLSNLIADITNNHVGRTQIVIDIDPSERMVNFDVFTEAPKTVESDNQKEAESQPIFRETQV